MKNDEVAPARPGLARQAQGKSRGSARPLCRQTYSRWPICFGGSFYWRSFQVRYLGSPEIIAMALRPHYLSRCCDRVVIAGTPC